MYPWRIFFYVDYFLDKYGPIVFGLIMGILGKYALHMQEGKKLTWPIVISDMFLVGFLAICAKTATEQFNLPGNFSLFVSALLGISSYRVARLIREKWLVRLERYADALPMPLARVAKAAPETFGKIPPSSETVGESNYPGHIDVMEVTGGSVPTTSSELYRAIIVDIMGKMPSDSPEIMEHFQELLGKLDQRDS